MLQKYFVIILWILIVTSCLLISGCSTIRLNYEPILSATSSPETELSTSKFHQSPIPSKTVTPTDTSNIADITQVANDSGETQKYDLNTEDITNWFKMNREDTLQMIGSGYEILQTGADDSYEGYYYKKLGLTFIFSPTGKSLTHIACDENVLVNDAHAGMNFDQIQRLLGETKINSVYLEDYQRTDYFIDYIFNNIRYKFSSNNETGEDSRLTIMK